MNMAGSAGHTANNVDLAKNLRDRPTAPSFEGVHPRPNVAMEIVLGRPPLEQDRKALRRGINWPIELRRQVIHPAFLQPFTGVCEKLGISIFSPDLRRSPRAPNAERADSKFHPGLRSVYRV